MGTELVETDAITHPMRTPERAAAFCAALAETGHVTRACKAVGMNRTLAYKWREDDEEFRSAWDRALQIGLHGLHDEAVRRGVHGIDELVIYKGSPTPLTRMRRDVFGEPELTEQGDFIFDPVLDENGEQKYLTVKRYSDTLLSQLLKAHDPRFKDKVEIDATASFAELLRAARERATQPS